MRPDPAGRRRGGSERLTSDSLRLLAGCGEAQFPRPRPEAEEGAGYDDVFLSNYATINLIDRMGAAESRARLERSFAQFQADRSVVGLTRGIERNEAAMATLRNFASAQAQFQAARVAV